MSTTKQAAFFPSFLVKSGFFLTMSLTVPRALSCVSASAVVPMTEFFDEAAGNTALAVMVGSTAMLYA